MTFPSFQEPLLESYVSVPETLASMESDLEQLTLVANSPLTTEAINFTDGMKYLQNLVSKAKAVANLTGKQQKITPAVTLIKAKAIYPKKELERVSYLAIHNATIYKPMGLGATFVDLLNLLNKYEDIFENVKKESILPYTAWVLKYINNPEELSKVSSIKLVNPNGEQVIKDFAKLFNGREGMDAGKVGDLLPHLKDVERVAEGLEKLTDVFGIQDLSDVMGSLGTAVSTVDQLVEAIKRDSELYLVSKKSMMLLGQETVRLAQLMSAYSLYITKLQSFVIAMKDNYERFEVICADE